MTKKIIVGGVGVERAFSKKLPKCTLRCWSSAGAVVGAVACIYDLDTPNSGNSLFLIFFGKSATPVSGTPTDYWTTSITFSENPGGQF